MARPCQPRGLFFFLVLVSRLL